MIAEPYTVPDGPAEQLPPAPARPRWPLATWIIPDGIIALLVTFILSFAVIIAWIGFQVAGGADLQGLFGPNGTTLPMSLLFGLLAAQNLAFAGVVLLRTRVLRKLPLHWIGLTAPRPLRLIGWGVLFGLLFVTLNFIVGWIFAYFGIESDQADLFQLQPGDTVGQALMFIGAVVAAPIGEELFFRGYIFKALRENSARRTIGIIAIQLLLVLGLPILAIVGFGFYTWSDVGLLVVSLAVALVVSALVPSMRVRAYLLSSALFAVVHLGGITQGAVALLAATFIGGLCLAGAFDRTQSLLPSIIAHGINNSIAFGQLLYCVNTYGSVQNCG
ncbi:MAG TPA: type II CAAX endopeptidase family protein [Herpetosiphonaceae bacterium]